MAYKDLRDFIQQADRMGQLKRLGGVDWDLEVGVIAQMTTDAVIFDAFAGYPRGYRIMANQMKSMPLWLLAMNMTTEARGLTLIREWRDRLRNYQPIPPKFVEKGPISENIDEGKDVNVLKFPVPKLHPDDVGRYIGTADALIMRDPDDGRINIGTYRVQVHDEASLGVFIAQGKDGALILDDYLSQGKACPIVALVGIEPALFIASGQHMVHLGGWGEYDFAGWLKGEPIEVITGEFTGLPIPASAEIAIEGEVLPGDTLIEGPFGEWTGYSEPRQAHVIRVRRVLYRDDPILTVQAPFGGSPPTKRKDILVTQDVPGHSITRAGLIWDEMEKAGIRGIQGVALHANRFIQAISIKNRYAGQVRQAGHVAAQCHAGGFMHRYTIVVDEDVDPTDINAVMFAVAKYADPARAIDIVKQCWSDRMDPALPYEERAAPIPIPPVYNTKCIIDACRPVEWDRSIKKPVVFSAELKERMIQKWGDVLFSGK